MYKVYMEREKKKGKRRGVVLVFLLNLFLPISLLNDSTVHPYDIYRVCFKSVAIFIHYLETRV
jgi:hypothetical protein